MSERRDAMSEYAASLDRALALASGYLASLGERPVWPRATYDEILRRLRAALPEEPVPPDEVLDELAGWADPGLTATGSGRFFGFVIGGAQPAALAAEWLAAAWDQNAGLCNLAPAAAAAESVAATWLLDLLDLPRESSVGFVTGATTANLACLGAARHSVLARSGYDVERLGLARCPEVRVLVGADRHDSVDLAIRYLGLGTDSIVMVETDEQGRMDPSDLRHRLAENSSPTIVCLQAGEVHTGAFDPFGPAIEAIHAAGAWAHVDGAFGLWARAGQTTRWLTEGVDAADSWCTDCHKTLNVPYDSGLAIVRDPRSHYASFAVRADYLLSGDVPEPADTVPEISRRARGFAVWAALRANGRRGIGELVDRLHARARRMADGIESIPGARVVNRVDFTQVMVALDDRDATEAVGHGLLAEGTAAITPATWRGEPVQRISLSNWSTSQADVDATVTALARIVARTRCGGDAAGDGPTGDFVGRCRPRILRTP